MLLGWIWGRSRGLRGCGRSLGGERGKGLEDGALILACRGRGEEGGMKVGRLRRKLLIKKIPKKIGGKRNQKIIFGFDSPSTECSLTISATPTIPGTLQFEW